MKKIINLLKNPLVLVALGLIIAIPLIMLFVFGGREKTAEDIPAQTSQTNLPTSSKDFETLIYFEPSLIDLRILSLKDIYSTAIYVDSKDVNSSVVVLELNYDPRVVEKLEILIHEDSSLVFGQEAKILSLEHRRKEGFLIVTIGIESDFDLSTKYLIGPVATIQFSLTPNATNRTLIDLGPQTKFIVTDGSVPDVAKVSLGIIFLDYQ